MSAPAPGCVKSPSFNLRVEHLSQFRRYKNQLHCDLCREKAIEKTILRILGSCDFSHSLGQSLPKWLVLAESAFTPIAA